MRGGAIILVFLVLSGPVTVVEAATPTPTAATPPNSTTDEPRLVGIYPNPAFENDRGEFVVVAVPAGYDGQPLSLTDGETVVTLPTNHSRGRIAVATEPVARDLTDLPVVLVEGQLRLANDGEWVALLVGDEEVDRVTYPRAPEGSIYRRTRSGWTWQRLGATAFPIRRSDGATARVFVLPDAPDAALAPLREAETRLWVAAYELTDATVVEVLCAATDRGVDTRVLVELEPVSGMTVTGTERLDRLVDCGVDVRVVGGPRGRYTFHHPKYAVADDRAVVLTENWKPAGVGGRSSRGWGAVVTDPVVAEALAETFAADAGWRDARSWPAVRAEHTASRTEAPANGSYPPAFTPATVAPVDVEVVVAPDNAEARVVGLIDAAERSIRVIQVSVGGPNQPFVRALIRAARRGVTVQLLLADAWYVREDNQAIASALEDRAREENLPLRVRLASPQGRYGKIHAKGVVVDGDRALVGSLNWNNVSARQNREVLVLLHGEAAARYYARVFDADWQGGRWRVPAGLVIAAIALWAVASGFAARRLTFDAEATEEELVIAVAERGES